MSEPVDRSARMRIACDEALLSLVGPNLAERWWNCPNKAFGGRTPAEEFEIDPSGVYQYLIEYCMGNYQ